MGAHAPGRHSAGESPPFLRALRASLRSQLGDLQTGSWHDKCSPLPEGSGLTTENIMTPFKKILVPIDFSPHAQAAIEAALSVAKHYDGSITLVHVFEPIAIALPEGGGFYPSPQLTDAMRETERMLHGKRDELSPRAGKAVEVVQRNGSPPHEIVELAKSHGFDLIVLGTHGRTGLAHMLIGSVAERVVRSAPCAVLTVHAPKTTTKA
jgi:nucleotide-binding universal stress UspA family protein